MSLPLIFPLDIPSPAQLFRNGEVGLFCLSDIRTMFTDAAGTTPVTASMDYIGKHLDLSGNGYHFTQGTSTARFQFFGNYYKLDLTDDVMSTTLPAIASGTVVVMTSKGTWFDSFSCTAGAFNWGPTTYTGGPTGLFTALRQAANDYREIARFVINRTLTAAEKASVLAWAKPRGCPGEITLGSDLRSSVTLDLLGTATGSYNSATGDFSIERIDASNMSSLTISGVSGFHLVAINPIAATPAVVLRADSRLATTQAQLVGNSIQYAMLNPTSSIWINHPSISGLVARNLVSIKKVIFP